MALRAVLEHPKFAAFKMRLGLRKCEALGYLEGLWHFCGRFTPQGNVGKYSNLQIESWLEWSGSEGGLIAGLIAEKWLDECPESRLIVHDWDTHADKATKQALTRSKRTFLRPVCVHRGHVGPDFELMNTESASMGAHSSDLSTLPVPEPVPEPVPHPHSDGVKPERISNTAAEALIPRNHKPKGAQISNSPSIADRGKAFLAKYPKQEDVDKAFQVYISIAKNYADCAEIDQGLDVHLVSLKWTDESGNVLPDKAKSPYWFLFDGNYKDRPRARGPLASSGVKYWKKSEEQVEREKTIARETAEDAAAAKN